ncbi:MAG: hypothetical protein H7Z11_11520 [Verrucomicrobia bacterium]|nr:hypothetical protein [Leptolyngbya sp. ES-bin-22]
MISCPLCSDILLRHLRSGKPYWLCRRCRLEILEKNYPTHASSKLPLPQRSVALSPMPQLDAFTEHVQQQLPPITTEV